MTMPRLFRRQRVLLALLSAVGGKLGERDVQWLLFDYGRRCRERGIEPPYDFIADEGGPRSFTAMADRDKLAARGFLVSGAWHLTPEGHRLAGNLKNGDVSVFAASGRSGGRDPVAGGKRRPPATRGRDEAARSNGRPRGGLLATIGYEGRSYEAYFNELLRAGITRLCDVRRNPISRKWGFSKRLLQQGCDEFGIRYEPFRELGVDSGARSDLTDRAAYERLFAQYEATTLPRCQDAVARIAGWIDAGDRVAITCYERDSGDCHRSRVASAVMAAAAQPLRPKHL
ncbi:MAG: DUF488 domain-containing protein [Gemmatimonadota bacterium]|uniref:DUF488 domain-containing protein n=1 Tax=Candidatus Palauibacter scopulicola TaxID=3056741 RepID=UPI0023898215|nr:DUF488 domain-containing protein [Candidatus Palauibacter scopulicola]MDE2663355.1 DUF488 domain-containing protein [Candidatus Palauibacter scopulicola]